MKLLLFRISEFVLLFHVLAVVVAAAATANTQALRGGSGTGTGSGVEHDAVVVVSETTVQHRELNPAATAADTYIFRRFADGAAKGEGDKVGRDCSTDTRRVTFVETTASASASASASANGDDAVDYMDITTTKWHIAGYRMDCVDKGAHTGWKCIATCAPFPNPNFKDWTHLTFEAKVPNLESLQDGCEPRMKVTKRYPGYSSNTIELKGDYVDGSVLSDSEYRRVVIPIADLATEKWPDVNGVKDIFFLNCAMHKNPHYHVRNLLLTSSPPTIGGAPDTPSPTALPSSSPTTSEPTASPTPSPTEAPTDAYWPIFESVSDEYSGGVNGGSGGETCFVHKDRLGTFATHDAVNGDYITMPTDPWYGAGIRFGCMKKNGSWQCISSCYSKDGRNPDWDDKLYLTFQARVENGNHNLGGCRPKLSLSGGGWPRKSSYTLELEDSYVDAGYLVSDEWRRVVIPLDDLKTDLWSLTDVYGMYLHTCGTNHNGPTIRYHVKELAVTNNEFPLLSLPPSSAPSVYVANDPLEATHRWAHKNWYPIFGPDREPIGHSWMVATDNTWPAADAAAAAAASPQSITILIPEGQDVMYSGTDATAYDKIIVEGRLAIQPMDADVSLTVGTIVVEKGGVLDIQTSDSSHSIEIIIEGALDRETDPEEQLLGIISLEGNLTITGDAVPTKMAIFHNDADAGGNSLRVDDSAEFAVGGELVLPDTQRGLDVGHWNFGIYVDQTETCVIASIAISEANPSQQEITCESSFEYDHSAGFTAGYITRSITIRTSSDSIDNGHILHTGVGKFDVSNTRIEDLGRTTTDVIDSTIMAPDEAFKFRKDSTHQKMVVTKLGNNQIARYALHAHHSLVESRFEGNALLFSPRDGCVAHNSRVHIVDNVIVGADGTGIFLEDATETGPVLRNYVIGTGGGSRGGDDGRFSTGKGLDMAHGGFGIWARGKLALIKDNHCEGHFGQAPYAFFVHPKFLENKVVPDVPGTPEVLRGKNLRDIPVPDDFNGLHGLQLQHYGGFVNNSAIGTFAVGIALSYFSSKSSDVVGSIVEVANITALASSGRGISTTHSRIFTLNDVTIDGAFDGNTLTGIWCNSCNGCTLQTPNTTLAIDNVGTARGGNC